MKLLSRLFPKAAELEAARKQIELLEASREELRLRNKALWESNSQLETQVKTQRKELSEVREKLRDQNDADLLLVSARIAVAVLKGQKPEASDLALQQSLYAQSNYAAQLGGGYRTVTGTSGSLLSALGLGGILG